MGVVSEYLAVVAIPLSVYLLFRRGMYIEILTGFLFILVLSDSRQLVFHFAVLAKDFYILTMGIILFTNRSSFRSAFILLRKFLPFILIASFCLFFSEVLYQSMQRTFSYVLILIVVPAFLIAAWDKMKTEAFLYFVWFVTLLLLVGLILRFIVPEFVTLQGRFNGLLGNPNGLGLFCTLFFILLTVVRDAGKINLVRNSYLLIVLVVSASVLLCGSRNAVFTIGIFFMFVRLYRVSPVIGYVAFIFSVVVYQLVVANIVEIVVSLNLQNYFRLETLENASGRLVAWEFGWERIKESLWLGNGIGHTDNLYKNNYQTLSILGHQGNAHNSYITFWLDTGVFGLLFYIIALLRSFFTRAVKIPSAAPALFAIMFSAYFESWLTASLNPLTIQCVIVMTVLSGALDQPEYNPYAPDDLASGELRT